MKFIDSIMKKSVDSFSQEDMEEIGKDIVGAAVEALAGSPIVIAKLVKMLATAPFMMREKIFWKKIEDFLNGVYLSPDDIAEFKKRLNGMDSGSTMRLINLIEKIDSEKKMKYMVNAARSLIKGDIDAAMFFRICNAMQQIIEEDLHFLHQHIGNEEIPYSIEVQGLLSAGLMYQSVIDAGNIGEEGNADKYSVTLVGKYVDAYAIAYNESRCQGNAVEFESGNRTTRIAGFEIATDEEFDEMLNDVFPLPDRTS